MTSLIKLFLPKYGGPWRRWLRVKEARWDKYYDLEHDLKGPVALFDFSDPHDAYDALVADLSGRNNGWRITDDEMIGGHSCCHMKLIRTIEEYQQFIQGKDIEGPGYCYSRGVDPDLAPVIEKFKSDQQIAESMKASSQDENLAEMSEEEEEEEEDEEEEKKEDEDEKEEKELEFIPFIRWWGEIDTRVGLNSHVQRSGYCAIQSPEFPWNGAFLGSGYNAMELLIRTDGRKYIINLKVDTYFPEDLYQAPLVMRATHSEKAVICPKTGGRFDRVVLRFQQAFLHTSRGRLLESPKLLDGGISIEHMGILLRDGVDGSFEFDIARIRAVNLSEHNEILGEDDEDAPY